MTDDRVPPQRIPGVPSDHQLEAAKEHVRQALSKLEEIARALGRIQEQLEDARRRLRSR
jgi:hypothetical protein